LHDLFEERQRERTRIAQELHDSLIQDVKIDVIVEGRERPLNATADNDVLQVGQQAITNALQHANARNIHVLLSYGEQQLRVRVQDNGSGINEETLNLGRPGHYGIAGMKERAERLAGSISIRSRVGKGTEVDLSVPEHLLYRDALPRTGLRLADKWHQITGGLRMRRPKPRSGSQSTPTETGSRAGKPDKTNS
jgi:signal transduction histidine kinase